jgi:hypothetical protein
VEEQVDEKSIVFIIPEQKYGVIVSNGAYASSIKYNNGTQEVIEAFDKNDFIISNEIIIKNIKET